MMFRICSFLIWAVIGCAAVFWSLRLAHRPPTAVAYFSAEHGTTDTAVDFSRLLGVTASTPEADPVPTFSEASRFQLSGVIAPPEADLSNGFALIAIDGKPAKHYSVGSTIDGELILQSVSRLSASIGPADGDPVVVLELPTAPAPATGVLTPPSPE